jgi:hypothetical protein
VAAVNVRELKCVLPSVYDSRSPRSPHNPTHIRRVAAKTNAHHESRLSIF